MRPLRPTLAAAIALAFPWPAAADAVCSPAAAAEVRIESVPTEIFIDTTKSTEDLTRLTEGSSQGAVQPLHMLGISRVTATVGFKIKARIERNAPKGICASPTLVEVRIAYSERRVFVAREANRDACVMSAALSHALRHARGEEIVLQHVAENYVPQLQHRLAGIIVDGPDEASAEEALSDRIKPELDKLLYLLDAGVREASAKADHPDEINRVTNACNGAVQKLLDALSH